MAVVAGFKGCKQCGGLVLKEVSCATEGLCGPCWLDSRAEDRHKVEVLMDGRTAKLSTHKANTRENARMERKRRANPVWMRRNGQVRLARNRAMRRVAALHRAEYLELYAIERAQMGLDPWPAVLALEHAVLRGHTGETMREDDAYDPGDAQAHEVPAAG